MIKSEICRPKWSNEYFLTGGVLSISEEIPRRRGRPAGKNRIPLSLQERRARNAQYERERRTETAEAMHDLAEAAGCDPRISNAELLATVITHLQKSSKRKSSDDIDELRRINSNLITQIAALEGRLKNEKSDEKTEMLNEDKTIYQAKFERLSGKRCLSESSEESDSEPEKIPKLIKTKPENSNLNVFKPQTTGEIKQKNVCDNFVDSSPWDIDSITYIESIANGIANQMDGSKLDCIPVQSESNITEQSPENQLCQSYENEFYQLCIEQSDQQNQCHLQSQSNSDNFTNVENGELSTWLECDDISEENNQSDTDHEMKWVDEDFFYKFTS